MRITDRQPPPTKIALQPGESPFRAAARELARNPDSPASLQIMSAVSKAMSPQLDAVAQLKQALAAHEVQDGPCERAAAAAAISTWESVCGGKLDPQLLQNMRDEAIAAARQQRRRPPALDSIVKDRPPGVTDTGYAAGIHLHGIEGTWHRLWGIICLSYSFGHEPDHDESVLAVRSQIEELLGRPLAPSEWQALEVHARTHAETEMPGRSGA